MSAYSESIYDILPLDMIGEIISQLSLISPMTLFNFSRVSRLSETLIERSIKKINTKNEFLDACKRGDIFGIIINDKKSPLRYSWKDGLRHACMEGHLDLAKYLFEKGDWNWNEFIEDVFYSGNMKFVNYLIEKNVDLSKLMFKNKALFGACKGGHLDTIKLLIENGTNDWNGGLYGACEGGHPEIVKLMIEKGADDWNGGLWGACEGGKLEIVKMMINLGASFRDGLLYAACRGGNLDIVKLIIKNSHNTVSSDWSDGLKGACFRGHPEIIKLMIEYGEVDNFNWDWAFAGACRGGYLEIVKMIILRSAQSQVSIEYGGDVIDWNKGMIQACIGGHLDIVTFMIEKEADAFYEGINEACREGHIDIVIFLLENISKDSELLENVSKDNEFLEIIYYAKKYERYKLFKLLDDIQVDK